MDLETTLSFSEMKRLEMLRAFDILNTVPEEEFETIARLASKTCGTPIALVSLVDAERQWFKASVGLDIEEMPRDVSFCRYAIAQPRAGTPGLSFSTNRRLFSGRGTYPVPTLEGKFMNRKASAVWPGDLKDGKGSLSTESGVLRETQYSFSTRFENGIGTNPEELIAAAHAGCFAMAFSAESARPALRPKSIYATATITLEKTDAGWTVTASHLDMTAKIPGIDRSKVLGMANVAKLGCPISRLLKANVTMDARLEG